MNIKYISLTGADDKVDIKDLLKLTEKYNNVELALLMFPERDGMARNPTKEWRNKFYEMNFPHTALHLCGSSIEKFAKEDNQLMIELDFFKRVQINLKPDRANIQLVEQLVKVATKKPNIQFITQHNKHNEEYFQYWNKLFNHAYLFDNSLGKGVCPEQWQEPVNNKFSGYAGGLNPANVIHELKKIQPLAIGQNIWIDMETGLRTNDQFDLMKAESVLKQVQEFLAGTK